MLTVQEILDAVCGSELHRSGSFSYSSEISSITTDTRTIQPDSLFLALKGDRFDGHDFLDNAVKLGAVVLCVNANYARGRASFAESSSLSQDVTVISVPDTLIAYQQIANCYRRKLKNLTVIGITGSCGKTSVKEILKTLLSALYESNVVYATEANNNNHIGVPLSLLSVKQTDRVAVIEMGTNHPGEIETIAKIAESDISIITTIARAHLEFFGDLNGVAEEKSAILAGYGRKAPISIIPEQCPGNEILRSKVGDACYTFGDDDAADVKVEYAGGNEKGSSFRLLFSDRLSRDISISELNVDWQLTGKHQALNAAAAMLAVILCDRTLFLEKSANIAEALKQCRLTGMRMNFSEVGGIKWINDAYNANPDSMSGAIMWLAEFADSENSHIVFGDMLEMGADAEQFHKEILELAVKLLPNANIYTVGPIFYSIANFANIQSFKDSETVSAKFATTLKVGDLVFLKGSRGIGLEVIIND